jgi:hypothetical protein
MYAPSKVLKTAERDRKKCSHHSDGDKSWMEARSGGESSKGRAKEAEASTTAKRFTAFCNYSKQPDIEEIAGKKWRVEIQ